MQAIQRPGPARGRNPARTEGEELKWTNDAPGADPLPIFADLSVSLDLPISADLDCADVLYAVDPDLGYLLGTCDPDKIHYESLFSFNGIFTRCSAAGFDGEGNLFGTMLDAAQDLNSLGHFNPETGKVEWVGPIPTESPIQSIAYAATRVVDVLPAFAETSHAVDVSARFPVGRAGPRARRSPRGSTP